MEHLELLETGRDVRFTSTWENSFAILYKLNMHLTHGLTISLLGIYPNEMTATILCAIMYMIMAVLVIVVKN